MTDPSQPPHARGDVCVVLAAHAGDERLSDCLRSLAEHTGRDTPTLTVPATTTDVNRALSEVAPADVALLSAPCLLTPGWLGRLRDAALADTNTASASALAAAGTPLALFTAPPAEEELPELAARLAQHTLRLRPRLSLLAGPCVYLRRDALELVGLFDERLELRWALEIDFAQRCLLAGLAHVAADDVVVGLLGLTPTAEDLAGRDTAENDIAGQDTDASEGAGRDTAEGAAEQNAMPASLRERYPYLSQPPTLAASSVLPRALRAARRPSERLSVTLDARALGATLTGTQRHILELITALTATRALRLRLLVGPDTQPATVELLRALPQTEVLPFHRIDAGTPRSTIFHRPQQAFETADMRLALRLGERIVLSQLDLIAYRNPGYHSGAVAWESHRRVTRQALAAADRVVVFSRHTRLELLSDELIEAERLRTVPPGLDHQSPPEPRRPAGLEEDPAGFLLCLGTDFTHKNRLFALRLLGDLRERHGWQGRLVLAGAHIPHGSSRQEERDFLEHHPALRAAVLELGSIEESEKAWLMSHAGAVVYPSVYEGFGLIPFEAALSGVPCAFAPYSSLAEVLPPAAATILPWDPAKSAANVHVLLSDPTARERHVQSIAEAAGPLTWATAAAATVEVYEEAALTPAREAAVLSRDELRREQQLRELIAAHDALVLRLVGEREHAQRMYNELNTEVGFGLGLIGPRGALPEDLQRALLALSARPALSRPLYGALARIFGLLRALARGRSRRSG